MITNFNTYRKYITESVDHTSEVETLLQERGIEILETKQDLGRFTEVWLKSKKGKLYKMFDSAGIEVGPTQSVYLVFWDWIVKEGGVDPIGDPLVFVGAPAKGYANVLKAIKEIERFDTLEGTLVLYDKAEAKFNISKPDTENRQIVYLENRYIKDVNTFLEEMLRKVGNFHMTWYFKDDAIYTVKYNKSSEDYKVQKIESTFR